MKNGQKKAIVLVILCLIVVGGGILRIWGADWGLPTLLHDDEHTIVNTAIGMAERHSFEPDVFYRPDHLEIKINFLVYTFISRGIFHMHVEDLAAQNAAIFYHISRIISAFFGIGMIVMAYLIGSRIKKRIGLIAAALFAFFPGFITHSHYVTPDIPTGFFMMLFIYFAIVYLQRPTRRNLFWMCLSVSAFFTVKYPGAILCLCMAAVIIMSAIRDKEYKRIWKHGALAAILFIFLIFLISPTLITDIGSVRYALVNESRSEHLGQDGLGWGGNLWFYLKTYLSYSGLLLFAFFILGVAAFLKKNIGYQFIPVFSGVVYWLVLGYVALHWERWAIPMYVTPLLVSAIGIDYAFSALESVRKRLPRYALIVGLLLVSLNLTTGAGAELTNFIAPDTRVVSREYCEENGIQKSDAVYESFTPFKPTCGRRLPKDIHEIDSAEYVILGSYMYERFMAEPARYEKQVEKYDYIEDHFALVKEFIPPERNTSVFGIANIYYNLKYICDVRSVGFVGPDILFYRK